MFYTICCFMTMHKNTILTWYEVCSTNPRIFIWLPRLSLQRSSPQMSSLSVHWEPVQLNSTFLACSSFTSDGRTGWHSQPYIHINNLFSFLPYKNGGWIMHVVNFYVTWGDHAFPLNPSIIHAGTQRPNKPLCSIHTLAFYTIIYTI